MAGGSQWRDASGKTHYERHKQPYVERASRRRRELRQIVRELKERPCKDCGVSYPYFVMDFDHRDPALKLINPNAMATRGWAIERIRAELEKCDVVCSNCHRVRTHRWRT